MTQIHHALHSFFHGVLSPFPFDAAGWVLLVISLVTASLSLLVFKYTSNQRALERVKNRMKAHLLEIRLFKDSPGIILSAHLNLLWWNLRYLGLGSKPLLVLLVPILFLMVQMQCWFGWRPLRPGESFRVVAILRKQNATLLPAVQLVAGEKIEMEIPPLRVLASEPEINWRLRVLTTGQAQILLGTEKKKESLPVSLGPEKFVPVWPEKLKSTWWNNFLAAGQPPLDSDSQFEKLEVEYPEREMNLLGWKMNWIWVFLLETLLFSFLLKGVFKVEF